MREFWSEYWTVVFALGVVAAVITLALVVSYPPVKHEPGKNAAQSQADDKYTPGLPASAEEFWARLRERPPELVTLEYACPCDGEPLQAPAIQQDNMLGGVATDLMAIQLIAPKKALGRPDYSLQKFNDMLVTCPNDLATFEYLDLSNFENGLVSKAQYNLRGWKLADDAPELTAIPLEKWTVPERHLAHYFTMLRAGLPDYEIGWRILSGAHAANFAVWHGDEYVVPSPVFYELAALHMRRELDNPESQMSGQERAITAQMTGELFRLLGRGDDALACCKLVEQETLNDKQHAALDVLKQRLAARDYVLQRDTVLDVEAPPVGWYLDMMLPAINSHIMEHRGNWNTLNDPAEVARQALALLKPQQ